MQAGLRVVMPRPGEVTIESYEVPEPGPGHVLIQTEASAISSGTELAVYTGVHQWLTDPTRSWPRFPFVPGYSAVGRIVRVGEGVEAYAANDRVIWAGRHESHAVVNVGNTGTASPHQSGGSAKPSQRQSPRVRCCRAFHSRHSCVVRRFSANRSRSLA